MENRRVELRMTWGEVATQAKVSTETLRALRRGNNEPAELTRRAIEDALRWAPGSINALLRGRDATPADSPLVRLGALLPTRRIELNPGYAARRAFAAAAGLDEAFIEDIEYGRIPVLDEGQRTIIERAYEWAPGSVLAVLSGGDPVPLDRRDVSGTAYLSATAAAQAGEIF